MSSKVVEASTDGVEVFTSPVDKITKIKSIEINNQSASDVTITVNDTYVPFPTENNPEPEAKTTERKVATVKAGDDVLITFDDPIEILGTCTIVASETSSDVKITVTWREE